MGAVQVGDGAGLAETVDAEANRGDAERGAEPAQRVGGGVVDGDDGSTVGEGAADSAGDRRRCCGADALAQGSLPGSVEPVR